MQIPDGVLNMLVDPVEKMILELPGHLAVGYLSGAF